jgi:hypothetical protein
MISEECLILARDLVLRRQLARSYLKDPSVPQGAASLDLTFQSAIGTLLMQVLGEQHFPEAALVLCKERNAVDERLQAPMEEPSRAVRRV